MQKQSLSLISSQGVLMACNSGIAEELRNETDFTKMKWVAQGMPNKCQSITEWNISALRTNYNEQPAILTQINHIKFNNLSWLTLDENLIQSIEKITWMYLPQLINLSMRANVITKLNALRKCHVPEMRRLSVGTIENNEGENFIEDFRFMKEVNAVKLETVTIEISTVHGCQSGSISWSVQTNSQKLELLCINSKKRIVEEEVTRTLDQKYLGIEVRAYWVQQVPFSS